MHIDNHTAYDTRTLHRLVTAVHRWMAEEIGRRAPTWKRLTCEVRYARNAYGDCTGWAILGGRHMVIRLPKPPGPKAADRLPVRIASAGNVTWHELMHIYGYGHDKIAKHPDQMFAWLNEHFGEWLAVATPKARPVVTLDDRLAHITEAEKRWTTKLKRAETWLKKLGRRRRRLERQRATTVAAPETIATRGVLADNGARAPRADATAPRATPRRQPHP